MAIEERGNSSRHYCLRGSFCIAYLDTLCAPQINNNIESGENIEENSLKARFGLKLTLIQHHEHLNKKRRLLNLNMYNFGHLFEFLLSQENIVTHLGYMIS